MPFKGAARCAASRPPSASACISHQASSIERVIETGRIGIWSAGLRDGDPRDVPEAAAELEELGFGTIWVPGRGPDDLEERLRLLLGSTERITIATGIVSIW